MQALCQRPVQRVDHQGRFPRSGDPGHTGHHSQGDSDIDPAQVVGPGAVHGEEAFGDAPRCRQGDHAPPGEVVASQRVGCREDGRRWPLGDDLPAVDPGPRAHIDDVIGAKDRFLVVLDHQHGVA